MLGGLSEILKTFTPVSLHDMDAMKLMDRVDTKFVMTASQLPEFLKQLNTD